MRHVFIMTAAALALAGCQKSVGQQFAAMCADQKANDPVAWSSSEGACAQADYLSDEHKQTMLDAYAELKRARAAVMRSSGE